MSKEDKHINENSIEATKKKQLRNLAIVAIVFLGGLGILYFMISESKATGIERQQEKAEFASPIKHVDAGSILIEKTEARLAQAEKITEGLQKNIEELNNEKIKIEQEKTIEQQKSDSLIKRLDEIEKKVTAPPVNFTGTAFSGQPGVVDGQNQNVLMTQGIRDDAISLSQAEDYLSIPKKNIHDYVPSGTFVKAVALGGADASAAVNAQSNPQPMLFRIIEDGTMPNNQKSRLKGCLATAAVVGDISSERGFIRLETLSCVEPNTNRVIDLNVEGTVFGPEGKSGIRGTPMWREGALLQRVFAAGALSGLANSVSQKYTQTSISPLGAIQTTSSEVKDILARSAVSGLGNAMEKLADYNIKRAEQYHPVLQLSAGAIVDLVFLKGFYLSDEKGEVIQNKVTNPNNSEARVSNLNNMPQLTITPEQSERLKERQAELNS
jgi:conjugal transfer pilus assembly protein TraB